MAEPHCEGFDERFIENSDGLKIYARIYNAVSSQAAQRLPLICLAGLTRNSRDFHRFARTVATHETAARTVITIDTRGRGLSDRDEDKSRYTIAHEAGDVLAVCKALDIEKADFVGTSRGGIILLLMAATNPQLLNAVVLNDVGPALGLDGLKLIRTYLSKRPSPPSWESAIASLKLAQSSFFPALDDDDWENFARATYREIDGKITPDYDPAITEAVTQIDLDEPLPDMWPQFEDLSAKPLLAIRGEYSTLLEAKTLAEMKQRAPSMHIYNAQGQGHAPLLHVGGITNAILNFLTQAKQPASC